MSIELPQNDSVLLQQLTKAELLPLPQLQTNQQMNKIITRYQHKVQQLSKMIRKEKKHNESLTMQLKTLNDTLNNLVGKLNPKGRKSVTGVTQQTKKEDVLRKQLQNQLKIKANMKKQIQNLRMKVKMHDMHKLQEMYDELAQKDKVIEQLHINLKHYEKLEKKDMKSDIYKREIDANAKINVLSEELIHLKKKLQEKEGGKKGEGNLLGMHHRGSDTMIVNDSVGKNCVTKQKQTSQTLQQTIKATTAKPQRQTTKLRIKQLEHELQDCKKQLTRKDKQILSLHLKIKMMHRSAIGQALQNSIQKQSFIQQLGEFRREIQGLIHSQGELIQFDDTDKLPVGSTFRIVSITVKNYEEHIVGIETEYIVNQTLVDKVAKENSQILTHRQAIKSQNSISNVEKGKEEFGQFSENRIRVCSFNLASSYQNVQTNELQLGDYQYIKQCEIYCRRYVEFIRMRTSKNQVFEVGNEKNVIKCKQFKFDIKNNEKPIALIGTIERKPSEREKEVLINFGFVVKRKDVFLVPSLGQSKVKLRKHASKSQVKVSEKNSP